MEQPVPRSFYARGGDPLTDSLETWLKATNKNKIQRKKGRKESSIINDRVSEQTLNVD
jgi:hypothetical protein